MQGVKIKISFLYHLPPPHPQPPPPAPQLPPAGGAAAACFAALGSEVPSGLTTSKDPGPMPIEHVIQKVPALSGVNSMMLSPEVIVFLTPKSLMTTYFMHPPSVLASTSILTGTPLTSFLGVNWYEKSTNAIFAFWTPPATLATLPPLPAAAG